MSSNNKRREQQQQQPRRGNLAQDQGNDARKRRQKEAETNRHRRQPGTARNNTAGQPDGEHPQPPRNFTVDDIPNAIFKDNIVTKNRVHFADLNVAGAKVIGVANAAAIAPELYMRTAAEIATNSAHDAVTKEIEGERFKTMRDVKVLETHGQIELNREKEETHYRKSQFDVQLRLDEELKKIDLEQLRREKQLEFDLQNLNKTAVISSFKDNAFISDLGVALKTQATNNELRYYRENESALLEIARRKYEIEQVEDGGLAKVRNQPLEGITYKIYAPATIQYCDNGDYLLAGNVCPTNADLKHDDRMAASKLLIVVPYFRKTTKTTFLGRLGRSVLKPFYSRVHIDRQRLNGYTTRYFPNEQEFFNEPALNSVNDPTMLTRLYSNYRFLGFEAEWVAKLFADCNDYNLAHNLDSYTMFKVHPEIYKIACSHFFDAACNEHKYMQVCNLLKYWTEYVPLDIVSNSVAAACQAMDVIHFNGKSGLGKVAVNAAVA